MGLLKIADFRLGLVIRSLQGLISVRAQLLELTLEFSLDLTDLRLEGLLEFLYYYGVFCFFSSHARLVLSGDALNDRVN